MTDNKETLRLQIKALELELELIKARQLLPKTDSKQHVTYPPHPEWWPTLPPIRHKYYPNPYTITCK